MEILFTSSYISNQALSKEVYSYLYFKRRFALICQAIMILAWVYGLVEGIFHQNYNWILLGFVPLYLLIRYLSYHYQVRAVMKRNYEMYGNEITVETIVTEEYIQSNASTGAVMKVEYCNIRKAVQTKNLILLQTKANVVLIFPKADFTKESREEFLAFLRGKGIKA